MRDRRDKIVLEPVEANLPPDALNGQRPGQQHHDNNENPAPQIQRYLPPGRLVEEVPVGQIQLDGPIRKERTRRSGQQGRSLRGGGRHGSVRGIQDSYLDIPAI